MIQREIINKRTGEKLIMFEDGDFENVKPTKHYGDSFVVKQMVLRGVPPEEMNGEAKPSEKSKSIFIEAVKQWNEMLKGFKGTQLPPNLIKVLDTYKKSEQEALLKGIILTPDILMAFLVKAEESGYTLSQYSSEFTQKGVDTSKMPLAYEVKNGEVKIFGKTELSDGQLKQAIEHRKVKIGKILDRENNWHCLFTTFKSLRGEETWLSEKQPHYHYLSSGFGLERTYLIEQLKSEQYKLGNLPHIKLEEYGNQPDKQNG